MFQSATLKLTGWYLLILMTISILFSVIIYQIASSEINTRLERIQNSLQTDQDYLSPLNNLLYTDEADEATTRIAIALLYANLLILITGGFGSYLQAKRTLRPIQEAHEAQSRFTSDASHELRTPLAAMKTEIEVVLRDEKSTSKDLRHALRSNLEEVEKLTRLSEMLLNLSRLDHDKLEHSAINLADLTQEVMRQYRQSSKRITVKTTNNSLAEGNEPAVFELISILIDNAIKYSPANSPIEIALSRRNRHVTYEISNTGPGIASDKLPHIFDRFYRADTSRSKTNLKGYGLGLSLAKKIIELHNGELSATSTPNKKTTFIFSLPAAA